ncbi:MAG: DUF1569 domain-containing protein [Ignavibacteria bacterium]
MQNIFSKTNSNDIVLRINKLSHENKPIWGKMNVTQMLAHCQVQLHVAMGDIKLKRNLMGLLLGRFFKKKSTSEEPFRKNLPTDKAFIITGDRDFNEEKIKLLNLIQKISDEGEKIISNDPHPFFGELTKSEWSVLIWKHLDHHLKQFGE